MQSGWFLFDKINCHLISRFSVCIVMTVKNKTLSADTISYDLSSGLDKILNVYHNKKCKSSHVYNLCKHTLITR